MLQDTRIALFLVAEKVDALKLVDQPCRYSYWLNLIH